jgi:hypothetical protein
MLQQVATRDNTMATPGTYDNDLPETEPTDAAYVAWKAKNVSTTIKGHVFYNWGQMFRYHKILKRNSKLGKAAMDA